MFKSILKAIWQLLLESAGENDYHRYRARLTARAETPLTPAEFYLANLERKYSRPNRCC